MVRRELAKEVIASGEVALAKVMAGGDENALKDWKLGALRVFSEEEFLQLSALKELMSRYLKLAEPPRPLCVAVFGQPGAGKSFGVEQIYLALKAEHPTLLPLDWKMTTSINLTQVGSPEELACRLEPESVEVRKEKKDPMERVPFVFFDEFDAPLRGRPLGWLSFLLAPMQDGTFLSKGEVRTLKRAIYVFAGGTVHTMESFAEREDADFRAAKGPDFVSRLRGHLNVLGPNHTQERDLRRALLIREGCERVERARLGEENCKTPRKPMRALDPALVDALLNVGRFRHGARSIHAILEMAAAGASPDVPLQREHLPSDHLLDQHADLGPLTPGNIGGLIAMSGGGDRDSSSARDRVWRGLAREIWTHGGAIAYGGHSQTSGLTARLKEELQTLPRRLSKVEQPPEPARLHVFATHEDAAPGERVETVRISSLPGLPGASGPGMDASDFTLARAEQLFRMRWLSTCRARARVVLWGKVKGSSGRMPGILEEVVLSLALGQPLYLIGAFGGATRVIGELLGLAGSPAWLELGSAREDLAAQVRARPELFRPAGYEHLPLLTEDAVAWLRAFAIGGPRWPENGLTLKENRELFNLGVSDPTTEEKNADRVVELVTRGLLRRFG